MDTILADGDFAADGNGLPRRAEKTEELLQRAMIRLRVPKGSFRYDFSLGSRLGQLGPQDGDAQALALAQEALKSLPQLRAENAVYHKTPPRRVDVLVAWTGGSATLSIPV